MRQKQSHSESQGRGAVNVKRPLTKAGAGVATSDSEESINLTAMEKFKSLTRRLLAVSREQLAAEQKRYESDKKNPNDP
jgi:hypothetical protein